MAETFKYTDSKGQTFDAPDTVANRQTVKEQGYTINDTLLHKVGEAAQAADESLSPIFGIGAKLGAKAIASVTGAKTGEQLKKESAEANAGKFAYADSKGDVFHAEDTPENRKAVVSQGYKLAEDDPSVAGVRGDVKAFLGNAANEYLFGLPKMAAEAGVDKDLIAAVTSPEVADPKKLEALERDHSTAATLGTAAGIVGNILTPGLNMEGVAVKAEALAARGLGKLGVTGASLGGEVALKAAGTAAKGLAYSAPRAAGELAFHEDPAAAAEVLLAGGLSGAALGAGGAVTKRLGRIALEGMSKGGEALVEGASAKLARVKAAEDQAAGRLGPLQRAVESSPGFVEQGIDAVAGNGVKTALGAIGLSHGPVGYIAGHVAGQLLDRPGTQKAIAQGAKLVGRIAKGAAEKLDSIPNIIDRMAQPGVLEAGKIVTDVGESSRAKASALAELSGHDGPTHEQYEALRKKFEQLEANPGARVAEQAKHAEALSKFAKPEVVQQYQLAQERNFGWLATQMPRDPNPPQPFAGKSTWRPTDAQLSAFDQKLQIYKDPYSAIDELARGSLTRNHVAALDAMYPKVAAEMRGRVLAKGADPNLMVAPEFRHLLDLFGGNAGAEAKQARVQAYQAVHAQAKAQDQKGQAAPNVKALKDSPIAQGTRVQSLAAR